MSGKAEWREWFAFRWLSLRCGHYYAKQYDVRLRRRYRQSWRPLPQDLRAKSLIRPFSTRGFSCA